MQLHILVFFLFICIACLQQLFLKLQEFQDAASHNTKQKQVYTPSIWIMNAIICKICTVMEAFLTQQN